MNKVYSLKKSPAAKRYLKKIKDKNLQQLFKEAIEEICKDPYGAGRKKTGDLSEIYGYDFQYKGVSYRVAYVIQKDEDGNVVIIVLAGTREQFYKELKRYMKSYK